MRTSVRKHEDEQDQQNGKKQEYRAADLHNCILVTFRGTSWPIPFTVIVNVIISI